MAGSGRRTLTERRAEELRYSVALIAVELFALDGGTSTTVEAICERAGISQRTFYRHFAVKEDVVVPLFERSAESILEALEDASAGGGVVTVLAEIFYPRTMFRDGPPTLFQRRFLSVIRDSPEYLLRWHALDEPLTGPIADFLAARGLAGDAPFERRLRAGLVVHAARLTYYHWIRADAPQELDELHELLEQAMASLVRSWMPEPAGQG
ncbi:TetR/AcrR family transcriptional regulator [Spirillospora sp. NPDC029432]|uniref:TetR/AcrR family transcriptional regulator n=1 Tax=Spirillospora sp. NPDC029432 TaxID=3154599 RepID=UPI003453494F